jgi:bacteriorhodopsin
MMSLRNVLDFLLVGRSPLGSAVRGVLITTLLTLFWTLFFGPRADVVSQWRWPLFSVSLITALVVVAAAHLLSRRDNPATSPDLRDTTARTGDTTEL